MELKQLFTEERAVSPVIAVVLMIAVTVILAAIVAAFALGLGGGQDQTPQASFDFNYDGANTLVITHEGGDSLVAGQVDVLVGGAVDGSGGAWSADPIETGVSYTITGTDTGTGNPYVGADDEVRIRWTSDNGETATLGVYTVPA